MRNLFRRLQRLETRAAAATQDRSLLVRIHFVDPEKGLVSVLVMESGKPTIERAPTPEEKEWFRIHTLSKRHRASPLEIAADNK